MLGTVLYKGEPQTDDEHMIKKILINGMKQYQIPAGNIFFDHQSAHDYGVRVCQTLSLDDRDYFAIHTIVTPHGTGYVTVFYYH
jgi:hypothetical protein